MSGGCGGCGVSGGGGGGGGAAGVLLVTAWPVKLATGLPSVSRSLLPVVGWE